MDMNSYSGPTVAVLVEETPASWRVVGVFADANEVASWIGLEFLAGRGPAERCHVETVPAPFLADRGQLTEHEPNRGDLEAIASVISRNMPGSQTYGRGEPVAREVLKVVEQRMLDARSMAAQDAAEADHRNRVKLSAALRVPLVEGRPPAWQVLIEHLRVLQSRADWASAEEPFVLSELRAVLRSAQDDPTTVDRMAPSALLDLVRSLVEAVGAPEALRARLVAELDPAHAGNADRLERAADALSDYRGTPANEAAAAVVDAYLRED